MDFPQHWPDLMPWMLAALHRRDVSLSQHRALLCILHVVKALASRRLPVDRRSFAAASVQLVPPFAALFDVYLGLGVASCDESAAPALELAVLCAKALRRLLTHGAAGSTDALGPAAVEYVGGLAARLEAIVSRRARSRERLERGCAGEDSVAAWLEVLAVQLAKTLLAVQEQYPLTVAAGLPSMLRVCASHIARAASELGDLSVEISRLLASDDGAPVLPPTRAADRFTCYALNFLRQVLKCRRYESTSSGDGASAAGDADAVRQAQSAVRATFTPDAIRDLCRLLVTWYAVLPMYRAESARLTGCCFGGGDAQLPPATGK